MEKHDHRFLAPVWLALTLVVSGAFSYEEDSKEIADEFRKEMADDSRKKAGDQNGQPIYRTAHELYPIARQAAFDVDPNARFLGVMMIEATFPEDFYLAYTTWDHPEFRDLARDAVPKTLEMLNYLTVINAVLTPDDSLGDGMAGEIAFHFLASGHQHAFVVDARGSVIFHRSVLDNAGSPTGRVADPDPTWIDTDDLMEVLAEGVPSFQRLRRDYPEGDTVSMLSIKGGDEIWNVGHLAGPIMNAFYEQADMLVDARTRQILDPGRLFDKRKPDPK